MEENKYLIKFNGSKEKGKKFLASFEKQLYSFLKNKDYGEYGLSAQQQDLLKREFKKKAIDIPMLEILSKSSGFNEQLTYFLAKDLFSKSVADALMNNIINEEEIIKLVSNSQKPINVDDFFKLINYDATNITKQIEEETERKAKLNKKELDDKALKENEKLKKEIKSLKSELKKSNGDIENRIREQTKLDAKVAQLEQKIKELTDKGKNSDTTIRELEIENNRLKSKIDDDDKVKITHEKENHISSEIIMENIEKRQLVGQLTSDGIKMVGQKMLVIKPLIPFITRNSYLEDADFESFIDSIEYRGDYSTFVCLINNNFIKEFFPEKAESFFYLPEDEQYNLIYSKFAGKIIIFKPEFKKLQEREKRVLNANIVDILDRVNFNNISFVPKVDYTFNDLKKIVEDKTNITCSSYSITNFVNLKYVVLDDAIVSIDYIPSDNHQNLNLWKTNTPIIKKVCSLKHIDENDYIKLSTGIYVRNVVLIKEYGQSSAWKSESEFVDEVIKNAKSNNLNYTREDIINFHIAIKSSQLVILSGQSGTGKSKLPFIYAGTLGLREDNNALLFVPISPSYTEPEDVLGYVKPGISLKDDTQEENGEYMESSTRLTSFLKDAAEHKDRMHFVVFDEMNLSQIEYWFAPFISILEKDNGSRLLHLYPNNIHLKNSQDYPSSIDIGENVFFIGTINVDETTTKISERLIDRAIVINLTKMDFSKLKEIGGDIVNYPETSFSQFDGYIKRRKDYINVLNEEEVIFFEKLNELMSNSNYNKGISYRMLKNISLYLTNSQDLLNREDSIDNAVSQIIVNKISGTSMELNDLLIEDESSGILGLLNSFKSLSLFQKSRKLVETKTKELNIYGYTK